MNELKKNWNDSVHYILLLLLVSDYF